MDQRSLLSFFDKSLPLCSKDPVITNMCGLVGIIILSVLSPVIICLCLLCFAMLAVVVLTLTVVFYFLCVGFYYAKYLGRRSRLIAKPFLILVTLIPYCFGYCIVWVFVSSVITLTNFLEYTLIGLVINYKTYLLIVLSISTSLSYVYGCYRSTNESYNKLRKLLFDECIKLQKHRDSIQETKETESTVTVTVNQQMITIKMRTTNGQTTVIAVDIGNQLQTTAADQLQQPTTTPVSADSNPNTTTESLKTKLVYKDNHGSKLIKKTLFDDACSKFKPLAETFLIMVFNMFILVLFVSLISVAVLWLTPRTEIGRVAQASITVFVASIPYIISVTSSDVSNTKLHKLDIENRLKEFVQSYLKESESTGDEETEDTFEYV